MIYSDNKSFDQIFAQNKIIVSVYHGVHLVWEAILSCFGKGFWIDDKPWSDDDGWNDNI